MPTKKYELYRTALIDAMMQGTDYQEKKSYKQIPKGNISGEGSNEMFKNKPNNESWFLVHGISIKALSKKDAIKKYNLIKRKYKL